MDSPWDQRDDTVTFTGTTDRCAVARSLPIPVMAAPTVLGKGLQEFIKEGPLQELALKKAGGGLAVSLYVLLHTACFHFEVLELVHVDLF